MGAIIESLADPPDDGIGVNKSFMICNASFAFSLPYSSSYLTSFSLFKIAPLK